MNNRLNLGDDSFTYEPQPIVFRLGRREITLRGCINSVDIASDYPDFMPYGDRLMRGFRDDRTATLKLSNVTMEERWVHDDPHVVELDRHGKKLRCVCKCSKCFSNVIEADLKECVCPDCKCNGAEVPNG